MSKDIRHFVLETKYFGRFDVVEYKEYQKLENIIKEARNKIENTTINCDGVAEDLIDDILDILDKENIK